MSQDIIQSLKDIKPQLLVLKDICLYFKLKSEQTSGIIGKDFLERIADSGVRELYAFLDNQSIEALVVIQTIILYGEMYPEDSMSFSELFDTVNRFPESSQRAYAEGFIVDRKYIISKSIDKVFCSLGI